MHGLFFFLMLQSDFMVNFVMECANPCTAPLHTGGQLAPSVAASGWTDLSSDYTVLEQLLCHEGRESCLVMVLETQFLSYS